MVQAVPQPTSQSPSRILRGFLLRLFQSKAAEALSKQAINERLV
jgi:hypothetical protein